MGEAARFASRPSVTLALCLACAGGCGPAYELPAPEPVEHAAPDSFVIRSLTVNGRELAGGKIRDVAADEPLEVKGEIDFGKGRPQPPVMLVLFVDESGDRPVANGGATARLGARTARGTPFSVSIKAPVNSGTYMLRLMAKPPKPARKESAGDGGRLQVYAEGELTVVGGE